VQFQSRASQLDFTTLFCAYAPRVGPLSVPVPLSYIFFSAFNACLSTLIKFNLLSAVTATTNSVFSNFAAASPDEDFHSLPPHPLGFYLVELMVLVVGLEPTRP